MRGSLNLLFFFSVGSANGSSLVLKPSSSLKGASQPLLLKMFQELSHLGNDHLTPSMINHMVEHHVKVSDLRQSETIIPHRDRFVVNSTSHKHKKLNSTAILWCF